jgi:hypothetical protein
MQQIADWLRKLGMSEYTQRFAENRIDLSLTLANFAGCQVARGTRNMGSLSTIS